jgi:hypothetical protein
MDWRPTLDRPASRAARVAGLALVTIVLGVVAARSLIPLVAHAFIGTIELIMNGTVLFATSLSVGMSVGSILGTIGRNAAGLLGTRQGSLVLTLLMAVGAVAAYGLQRLLGSDEESPR